jgi:hypothetical protein
MDEGGETSNWSAVATFRTPEPPMAPAPDPGFDPDPTPSGGNPDVCNSSKGSDIANCIESKYPQYLVAGVSHATREANMKFLRDRIIEHGKCKGLDLGLNLKKGGPTISVDFIAWKTGGHVEGVDVGSAWDDKSKKLNLSWHTYGPPNYGHPYYKDYGPVSCK